ncbi:DUF806 family protein [Lentilactobacillus kosonis]|uniref:Phage tail assembly n=1 Tax=Lentilactobacillus kosonis TaxID=2810561 RepID=A0A401FPN6_9LACO|nr:DUF806 family protein [Lentilactobacillus kosonis]GAY74350.1 phage tail assembly [Lentilactobacillus kosonis]
MVENHIYLTSLPEAIKSNTTDTIALLTESENRPEAWGNDIFHGMAQGVEVQIFYGEDFDRNTNDCEIELMQLFQTNGWRIANSRPHILDPDTNQVIKVFFVGKNKLI